MIYIDDNLDVGKEFVQSLDVERGLDNQVNLERRQNSRTLEQAEEARGQLKIDQEDKHELIYIGIDNNLDGGTGKDLGQSLNVERGLYKSQTLEQAEKALIAQSRAFSCTFICLVKAMAILQAKCSQ